jgi:two-component system sensor histidine kinase YesM
VIDNGTGMDKDKCDSLNGYINDLNEDFNSIGLRNVNQRIKLHYSDKYGVEILSSEGVGTIARITLPIIM